MSDTNNKHGRILIFMQGFFPGTKFGGPPVSVDNFCSLLKEYEVYIVTKNHDLNCKDSYANISKGWNNRTNCKVIYLTDLEFNFFAFKRIIEEVAPDVIYLQSFFEKCVFPCLLIAKAKKIQLIIAPRGELFESALIYKKIIKKIYINLFKIIDNNYSIFHATNHDEVIEIRKIVSNKMYCVENIPSIKYINCAEKHIKDNDRLKLIYLSRICKIKNLKFIIDSLHTSDCKISLDIFGPIEDKEYWDACKNSISKCKDNVIITYRGQLRREDYECTIINYDLFILTTFTENYGHAIVESILSNCPVIISKGTTPWDEINKNGGFTIPLDKQDELINLLKRLCSMKNVEYQIIKKDLKEYAENNFKLNDIKKDYIKMIKGVS